MAYVLETCKAGRTIEIKKYFSSRIGKKIERSKNKNLTSEAQFEVNERIAETKLRRILNANFGYKDIHLVLTYRKAERPSPEQARKDLDKFIRNLRTYSEKKLSKELKYVAVTEYKKAAIHHHLVIDSMDTRILTDLWKCGQPRPTYLDNTGDYSKLANYLIKETSKSFRENTAIGKRYRSSTNLLHPIPKKKKMKNKGWNKNPKPLPGYYIDKSSLVNGRHEHEKEVYSFEFQFYRMISLSDKQVQKSVKVKGKKHDHKPKKTEKHENGKQGDRVRT